MRAIDVVMLTKNSEYLLDKCLSSIYENVPVQNLIIVDGFSTDHTIEILNEAGKERGNVIVLMVKGSRARARQVGIGKVSSDWFMFVDSDVILSKGWFTNAQKNIKEDTGAIWGTNIDVIPNVDDKRFLKMQSLIARQAFNLRGGTHDALIRSNCVKDIKIPEQLHTYEDAYIMNWIKNKGYKVVNPNNIYCLHYKPPENWKFENAVSQAILELRCGLIYSHNFAYMLYYPVFMFYWFMQLSLQGAKGLVPR
jgi:glycosyltransferase involved in cell wall biosynthesis